MIAGLPRQPDVRVFVVGAAPGKTKQAMLHIHGGGFVSGHASGAAPNMQEFVTQFGYVAITGSIHLAAGRQPLWLVLVARTTCGI